MADLYDGEPSQVPGNRNNNFNDAMRDLNMNEQEQALYMRHLKNLHGSGGVDNPDGSRSSLYAITAGFGDKTYVLPTVHDGKILNTEDAIAKAKSIGLDKFPSYNSPEEAKARYDTMHDYMEKDTAEYLKSR